MINFNEQNTKLQFLQNQTWRNLPLPATNDKLKEYLIQTIQNFNNTYPKLTGVNELDIVLQNIITASPLNIQGTDFWDMVYFGLVTMRQAFMDINNNLMIKLAILHARDLCLVKESFKDTFVMIDHNDYNIDDIVRCLFLSGSFAIKDPITNTYLPYFSGTLIANQPFASLNFKAHTCLHGFTLESSPGVYHPITDYYFIPYGLDPIDDNAFQVERVHFNITQAYNNQNPVTLAVQQQKPAYGYKNSDYACAVIQGISRSGTTLQNILIQRQTTNQLLHNSLFPGFDPNQNSLPDLLGNHQNNDVFFSDFTNKIGFNQDELRYFIVIGKPGDTQLGFDASQFSISVNLENFYDYQPRQSLQDDYDVLIPPNVGVEPGRRALYCPSYPGMSGGIVLETFYGRNHNYRLCRVTGTVWGAERVYSENPTLVSNFVFFMSTINP